MAARPRRPKGATSRKVAEALNCSERYVRELASRGVIPKRAAAGWDLEACRSRYAAHLREVAAGRTQAGAPVAAGTPGASGQQSLAYEQARLAKEKADAQAMANAVARGELVKQENVRAAVVAAWANARARLLAIPTKGAPMLVGISAVAPMQAALTELVRDALAELAATRSLPVGLGTVDDPAGVVAGMETAAAPHGLGVGRPRASAKRRSKRRAGPVED